MQAMQKINATKDTALRIAGIFMFRLHFRILPRMIQFTNEFVFGSELPTGAPQP